jgi:hypothetical protein
MTQEQQLLMLRALAHEALARIAGSPADPITASAVGPDGRVVTVTLSPLQALPPRPRIITPCMADVLEALRQHGPDGRMTTVQVLADLERREWLHGESTVRHSLANLVALGKLTSRRGAPAGYRLATTGPPDAASAGGRAAPDISSVKQHGATHRNMEQHGVSS